MNGAQWEIHKEQQEQKFPAMVWGRIKTLVAKLISVKVLIFGIATGLALAGKIDGWIWLLAGVLVISSRLFEKIAGK